MNNNKYLVEIQDLDDPDNPSSYVNRVYDTEEEAKTIGFLDAIEQIDQWKHHAEHSDWAISHSIADHESFLSIVETATSPTGYGKTIKRIVRVITVGHREPASDDDIAKARTKLSELICDSDF